MIAALYVQSGGVYFGVPDVDPWDVERNAKLYDGQHPVVAHPPCGPWSRLRFMCTKQDPSCGPRAVEQVRAFGGVLEHPADSLLFRECAMPFPGELPDAWGGHTVRIDQVSWGNACVKPTWLYFVGVRRELVAAGLRTGGTATHRVTSGPRGSQLPTAHATLRSRTPLALRDWLLSLARSVALVADRKCGT